MRYSGGPRKTAGLFLASWLAVTVGCGGTSGRGEFQFQATSASSTAGTTTIRASARPDPQIPGRWRVSFQPELNNATSDVFRAASAALDEIFGSARGEIQHGAEHVQFAVDPVTGKQYWFWTIQNPRQRYNVLPLPAKDNGSVPEMMVWVE